MNFQGFAVSALLVTTMEAFAGVGIPILGFSVGDTGAATAPLGADLRKQGFKADWALEANSNRQLGAVFHRSGQGPMGWDRLAVIMDDRNQLVKVLYREEGFSSQRSPLLDVFYGSLQSKFAIPWKVMQRVQDEGIWFADENGASMTHEQCIRSTSLREAYDTLQISYATKSANIPLVDPRAVLFNSNGTPKCAVGYRIEKVIGGAGAGSNQTVVTSYAITIVDIRLIARDGAAREAASRDRARIEREQAVKSSAKPNL